MNYNPALVGAVAFYPCVSQRLCRDINKRTEAGFVTSDNQAFPFVTAYWVAVGFKYVFIHFVLLLDLRFI